MRDPLTGNWVLLGNYSCALPESHTLRDNDVAFVVTLMSFGVGEDAEDDVAELRKLYAGTSGSRTAVVERDGRRVGYHLVEMPDVTTPELLRGAERFVLEEATCFVDAALQRGNVLLHCHRGEKRSPTVLMAWMGTRGHRVQDALEAIDDGYRGKEGWGATFQRTRKEWIEELKRWNRDWADRQKAWSEKVAVSTPSGPAASN